MKVHVYDIDWDTTGDDLTDEESAAIKATLPTDITVEVDIEDDDDDTDEIVIQALEEYTELRNLGRWCINSMTYDLDEGVPFTDDDITDMVADACAEKFGSCVKSGGAVFVDDGGGGTWVVKVSRCTDN